MHPFASLTLVVALAGAGAADAQEAPAAAASFPNSRAQRDADKVFRMILMHADKPRRVSRDDKAPVPAAAAVTGRSAQSSRSPNEPAVAPAESVNAAATTLPAVSPASAPSPAAPPDSVPVAGPRAVVDTAPLTTPAPAPMAAPSPATPPAPKNVKLELIASEDPAFPSRLVRSLGSGSVVVQFDVLPDGTVSQPEVLRSSHRGLNAAAITAVSAWRFKPISETAPGVVELKFE
jgi:TonB family protein